MASHSDDSDTRPVSILSSADSHCVRPSPSVMLWRFGIGRLTFAGRLRIGFRIFSPQPSTTNPSSLTETILPERQTQKQGQWHRVEGSALLPDNYTEGQHVSESSVI